MQTRPEEKGVATLEVTLVFNQSTVTGSYATSPMKLLTPRSRGQSVITYASNFGGGMVAGDQTRLELHIGKGARCFVGTQTSTKIYRNPCLLPCEHVTRAGVDTDGLLVFAPAPVQPFAGSSYAQRQEFQLASGAGLVLLDWVTSGRTACGERWRFAHFSSRNEVWQGADAGANSGRGSLRPEVHGGVNARAECVFLDSLRLDSSDGPLESTYRTGRFNCFALLLLAGEPVREMAIRLVEEVTRRPVERRGPLVVSASPTQWGAVLRMAGEELAEVERQLRRHLAPLSRLLGEEPWSRRW